MRVAIIGNSGSGKSTLARQLARAHALRSLDLDTVVWEPGRVAVPQAPDVAIAAVQAFCQSNISWVVEGCYAGLIGTALHYAPTLLFLDPGIEACLANCRSRPWEPHKYKSEQYQDEKLEFLLAWVRDYYSRVDDTSLVAHQALFANYRGPKRRFTDLIDEQAPLGSLTPE